MDGDTVSAPYWNRPSLRPFVIVAGGVSSGLILGLILLQGEPEAAPTDKTPTEDTPDVAALLRATSRPADVAGLLRAVQASYDRLLDAMEQVESGGNVHAVGDGGRSRGPLQIQASYWQDAVEHSRRHGDRWALGTGSYPESVLDRSYARRVLLAYADRYGARTPEEIARVHNGGPAGARKKATLGYWARVRAAMRL